MRELVRGMGLACECFASAQEFLEARNEALGGCLVVDLRMPGMTGIELQRLLREAGDGLPFIFVTGFADVPTSVLAMKTGAVDFLEKPYQPAELRASIRRAMSEDRIRRRHAQRRRDLAARFACLDEEERAVLELLCQGEPMKSIANRLSISLRTAHSRRASILTKTDARTREELLGMFVELNQLEGRFE
ncbi:MAG: response regulator transcription factor [Pirellulales bacterium]|nr:response regulator transcription factor [Pirellulales bacterium]